MNKYPLKFIYPSGAIKICHNDEDVRKCIGEAERSMLVGAIICIAIAVPLALLMFKYLIL